MRKTVRSLGNSYMYCICVRVELAGRENVSLVLELMSDHKIRMVLHLGSPDGHVHPQSTDKHGVNGWYLDRALLWTACERRGHDTGGRATKKMH